MEFLIAVGPDAFRLDWTADVLAGAPLLTQMRGRLRARQTRDLLLLATHGNDWTNDPVTTLWDGHGVAGTLAFSTTHETSLGEKAGLIREINRYLASVLEKGPSQTVKGIFCALEIHWHSGFVAVAADPLTQYPLYQLQRSEFHLITNNTLLIEWVAELMKQRLTRSIMAGAFEAAFGMGAGDRTGFSQVSMVPPNTALTRKRYNENLLPVTSNLLRRDKARHYDELLSETTSGLADYMHAISKSFSNEKKIVDLTGGMDSRLVFGAARMAGMEDLVTHCGGGPNDPDKMISNRLCQLYGLKTTDYPTNYNGEVLSRRETACRAVSRGQGINSIYKKHLGHCQLDGLVRMGGGLGEIARSFYEPSLHGINPFGISKLLLPWPRFAARREMKHVWRLAKRGHPQTLAYLRDSVGLRRLMRFGAFSVSARYALALTMRGRHHHLFTRDFLVQAYNDVRSQLDRLLNQGAEADTLLDAFYIADRSRRHFGFTTQIDNHVWPSFEPLANPAVWALAHALPYGERVRGQAIYDLLRSMGGGFLLSVPFTKDGWPASLGYEGPFDTNVTPVTAPPTVHLKKTVGPRITGGRPDLPDGLSQNAQYLWHLMELFVELANGLPRHSDCWNVLDRSVLLAALNGGADYFIADRYTSSVGVRLLHMLIWEARADIHAPITCRV